MLCTHKCQQAPSACCVSYYNTHHLTQSNSSLLAGMAAALINFFCTIKIDYNFIIIVLPRRGVSVSDMSGEGKKTFWKRGNGSKLPGRY